MVTIAVMPCRWRSVMLALVFVCCASVSVGAEAPSRDVAVRASSTSIPDSRKMQNDLQQMSWPRFRSVIEAVPELRAGVDSFGPAGWQFVKDNYRHYPWKKSIDRLDAEQKRQLARLIEQSAKVR